MDRSSKVTRMRDSVPGRQVNKPSAWDTTPANPSLTTCITAVIVYFQECTEHMVSIQDTSFLTYYA